MNTRSFRQAIRRIGETLKERYRPEKIILFGSWAGGRPGRSSDIDLLIVKRTTQSFHRRLAAVRQLVSPYRRGIPFDPIVVTPQELSQRLAHGDQFLATILQSGKVLYARP
jgi:predicted nucleotidyltransferase